jgi:hypothetical protein
VVFGIKDNIIDVAINIRVGILKSYLLHVALGKDISKVSKEEFS